MRRRRRPSPRRLKRCAIASRRKRARSATPPAFAGAGLRKQTPEPVFGIIKSVLGFRQFMLRGLDNVRGEWKLVTMAPAFAGAGYGT
jgi:Transposase DDE domain